MIVTKSLLTFSKKPNFREYAIKDIIDILPRPCKLVDSEIYQLVTVKRRNEGIETRGIFLGRDIKTPTQFYLKSGDFLISKRQIVHGACEMVTDKFEDAIVSNEYTVLRGIPEILLTEYFNILSKTINMKEKYFLSSYGVDIEKMVFNVADWKKRRVLLPSIEEQTKVSNFFSLLNKKIKKQQEKVESLQQQKKGLMQKIFSKDQRFRDENGEEYPDWRITKLGEISDIGTGKRDVQNSQDTGQFPFFVRSEKVERINTYSYDGEAILIPGEGNIGKIYHYINGKFDFHQRVYKISDFTESSGKYVYYYMQMYFKKQAIRNSVKATVDSLRLPTFQDFEITLPSLNEQNKIASFLSKVDKKIMLEEHKLQLLKNQKQGLMQQMFI